MEVTNKDFVHFHVHSFYSQFDGLANLSDLVLRARELGFPALALTDHGNVMGYVQFLKECRATSNKKGDIPYDPIKPILGSEFYLARRMGVGQYEVKKDSDGRKLSPKDFQPDGKKGNRHLNIYAMNWEGYNNLCTLSQRSFTDGFYSDPRIDIELLSKHSGGLMGGSACISSVINSNLLYGNYDKAKKMTGILNEIFQGNFFLEVMYHGIPEEKAIIPDIFKLSTELNIPIVATNDCFVEGTFISTVDGIKKIEDITEGDLVLTHKNRYRKVKHINSRFLGKKENVYKVIATLGTYCFEATANHPVYVGEKKREGTRNIIYKKTWKNVGDLSDKDYLIIPKINPENIFCSDADKKEEIDLLDYYDAKNLIKRSFVKGEQEHIFSNRAIDRNIKIPRYIKIDKDFLSILGLYMAEGFVNLNNNQISFGVNVKELHFIKLVKNFFLKFGLKVEEKITGINKGGVNLRIVSAVFANLFAKMCGQYSHDKKIPVLKGRKSFMASWSREQLFNIMSVYIEGDGYEPINESPMMIGTTSKRLIYELFDVLNSIRILAIPTMRQYQKRESYRNFIHKNPNADLSNWNDLYVLHIGNSNKMRFQAILNRDIELSPIKRKESYLEDDTNYYVKVKKIVKSNYNKKVYNFEVDEDNTYIANGFIVHNCHYILPEQADSQEILMCMSSSRCIKDPKRYSYAYKEFYLKSAEDMAKIFGSTPHVLTNSIAMANRIDTADIERNLFGGMRLPKFNIPKEFNSAFEYLKDLAYKGLEKQGWSDSKKHREALEKELEDVRVAQVNNNYDFATYFLIVKDYIDASVENKILVGCGRGSGYASILLRCLDITYGVDPLKYDLIWERFLGFDSLHFIKESDFGFDDEVKIELDELEENRELEDDQGGVDRY